MEEQASLNTKPSFPLLPGTFRNLFTGVRTLLLNCGLCCHQTTKHQKMDSGQAGGETGLLHTPSNVPGSHHQAASSGNQVIKTQVCSSSQCPPSQSFAPQESHRPEGSLLGFLESLVLWKSIKTTMIQLCCDFPSQF